MTSPNKANLDPRFSYTFLKCIITKQKGLCFNGFVEEVDINSKSSKSFPLTQYQFVDTKLAGKPIEIHLDVDPIKTLIFIKSIKLVNAVSLRMNLHVRKVTTCIIAVMTLPIFTKNPQEEDLSFIFR